MITITRSSRYAVGLAAGVVVTAAAAAGLASASASASASAQPTSSLRAHSLAVRLGANDGSSSVLAAGAAPAGYGPADLRSAYTIPTSSTGKTVAVVMSGDDPTAESDLAKYRSTFGLSACTSANGCFKRVNQAGSTTSFPTDTDGSAAVALDLISATCPACKLLLVEATDDSLTNLGAAEDYAAAHAGVVSNGFGDLETSTDTSFNSHWNHPGVAIVAAAGNTPGRIAFPASSPNVIAVGGTTLAKSTGGRGWTETAWSSGSSGCSAYQTKPSWQSDTGCTRRTVSDMSALANPGVAIYDTTTSKGWVQYGGTAVSVAVIAGLYGLTVTPGTAQYSYQRPSFLYFNDITSGQTATTCSSYLCRAGTGYDAPTGVGTPVGAAGLGSTGVTLCSDNNYHGRCSIVSANTSSLTGSYLGNDALSSLRIPSGKWVLLYRDNNYQGICQAFNGNTPGLGSSTVGNDQVSSFKIATSAGSCPTS